LSKDRKEYTFKPNIPKQSLQPLLDKELGPNSARRRQSIKAELDMGMGKKKKKGSILSNPNLLSPSVRSCSLSSDYEVKTLQISVNIGGSKKQIQANVDDDAGDIATRFINEHEIDMKYLAVLTKLIN
jgi:hypothetical protein